MKKWLLLLGFALNFGGLCYGMDQHAQQIIQKRIAEARKIFEARKWRVVGAILYAGKHEEKELMRELLLAQSSEVLNDMSATDQKERSLFDNLVQNYTSEKNRRWERPERYKDDPPETGPLLKKLILNGLNFRIKSNGRYVYSHDHNVPEEYDMRRAVWFLELFHELIQENPNEAIRLCAGFESELGSYDQLLESRGEQPKFRTWLQGTHNQQHPGFDNDAPIQKAKPVFNKKLATASISLVLGCVVGALGYQVYKRYTQDKSDTEAESDDENCQKTSVDEVKP